MADGYLWGDTKLNRDNPELEEELRGADKIDYSWDFSDLVEIHKSMAGTANQQLNSFKEAMKIGIDAMADNHTSLREEITPDRE